MKNPHGVDLDEVRRNAETQGVDLSQITLFYAGLTELEELELARHKLLVEQTEAVILGRFHPEGFALFPDKVSSVYSLGA